MACTDRMSVPSTKLCLARYVYIAHVVSLQLKLSTMYVLKAQLD